MYGNPFNIRIVDCHARDPLFNCEQALFYYQQAARLTANKEFKARCTWMSAKCEHNDWLNHGNRSDNEDFVAGTYFKKMKASYSDTPYYAEVIRECGYFCQFVAPGNNCIRRH